jgi:uncharacterized protein YjbI with pentapeptide repeats
MLLLNDADLTRADLSRASLMQVNLVRAKVTEEQLAKAKALDVIRPPMKVGECAK